MRHNTRVYIQLHDLYIVLYLSAICWQKSEEKTHQPEILLKRYVQLEGHGTA